MLTIDSHCFYYSGSDLQGDMLFFTQEFGHFQFSAKVEFFGRKKRVSEKVFTLKRDASQSAEPLALKTQVHIFHVLD